MKPRFLADNDLNRGIVRAMARRHLAVDFEASQLHGMVDDAILEFAELEFRAGRLLVTYDMSTIPPIVPQPYPLIQAVDRL